MFFAHLIYITLPFNIYYFVMAYENKKGVALMSGSFLLFISLPYPLCHDCSADLYWEF